MSTLVLMTALVPTTGHLDLIRFASAVSDGQVRVLVSGRSFEPVPTAARVQSLAEATAHLGNVTVHAMDDDQAPQETGDHPDFWGWWREAIDTWVPGQTWDAVVASEPYGQHVADALGAQFWPYDIERVANPVSGTSVRADLARWWLQVLPQFRPRLMVRATMFGQESVGKTTLSRDVARATGGTWVPEYARGYLEAVGRELTPAKMDAISRGQRALQQMAAERAQAPVVVQDTDLYSTVGYYRVLGWPVPQRLLDDAAAGASQVYYLVPDDIAFEADVLRYGGDHRETSMGFWLDLLVEFGIEPVLVPRGLSRVERERWVAQDLMERVSTVWAPVAAFDRSAA